MIAEVIPVGGRVGAGSAEDRAAAFTTEITVFIGMSGRSVIGDGISCIAPIALGGFCAIFVAGGICVGAVLGKGMTQGFAADFPTKLASLRGGAGGGLPNMGTKISVYFIEMSGINEITHG